MTGAEVTVKLETRESAGKLLKQDRSEVHHVMRSHKTKIADSDERSLGYKAMTTVSNFDPEVRFNDFVLHEIWEFKKSQKVFVFNKRQYYNCKT